MQPTRWAFEQLAETIATTVLVAGTATAALGLAGLACAAAIHWIRWMRCRPRSIRTPEVLFVGRWADHGPELFLVGENVRRLPGPQERRRHPCRGEPGRAALPFARPILAEAMGQLPPTQLALAFANAQLGPVPGDGFVLSASDVEAWLNERHISCSRPSACASPTT